MINIIYYLLNKLLLERYAKKSVIFVRNHYASANQIAIILAIMS